MAKGQKRSSREVKKPKKEKLKTSGPAVSLGAKAKTATSAASAKK